jgi:hypothetical protein
MRHKIPLAASPESILALAERLAQMALRGRRDDRADIRLAVRYLRKLAVQITSEAVLTRGRVRKAADLQRRAGCTC